MTEGQPSIDVHTVVQVMEELIPSLTGEMETLVRQADAKKLPAADRRQFISKEYIRKSGELTEQICKKHKLDIREFQAALMFYHDNELFEQALARLSAEQKQRYDVVSALGVCVWLSYSVLLCSFAMLRI